MASFCTKYTALGEPQPCDKYSTLLSSTTMLLNLYLKLYILYKMVVIISKDSVLVIVGYTIGKWSL